MFFFVTSIDIHKDRKLFFGHPVIPVHLKKCHKLERCKFTGLEKAGGKVFFRKFWVHDVKKFNGVYTYFFLSLPFYWQFFLIFLSFIPPNSLCACMGATDVCNYPAKVFLGAKKTKNPSKFQSIKFYSKPLLKILWPLMGALRLL